MARGQAEKIGICAKCHKEKLIHARDLCRNCYQSDYRQKQAAFEIFQRERIALEMAGTPQTMPSSERQSFCFDVLGVAKALDKTLRYTTLSPGVRDELTHIQKRMRELNNTFATEPEPEPPEPSKEDDPYSRIHAAAEGIAIGENSDDEPGEAKWGEEQIKRGAFTSLEHAPETAEGKPHEPLPAPTAAGSAAVAAVPLAVEPSASVGVPPTRAAPVGKKVKYSADFRCPEGHVNRKNAHMDGMEVVCGELVPESGRELKGRSGGRLYKDGTTVPTCTLMAKRLTTKEKWAHDNKIPDKEVRENEHAEKKT